MARLRARIDCGIRFSFGEYSSAVANGKRIPPENLVSQNCYCSWLNCSQTRRIAGLSLCQVSCFIVRFLNDCFNNREIYCRNWSKEREKEKSLGKKMDPRSKSDRNNDAIERDAIGRERERSDNPIASLNVRNNQSHCKMHAKWNSAHRATSRGAKRPKLTGRDLFSLAHASTLPLERL